jgi:thioredoxin 1
MSTNVSSVSSTDFDREVTQSDKLVVVDFWAEWCGPCKMVAPLLDEIAREMPDKVKIVKVNVDHEQQLAQKFGIYNIPTLLFFKSGTVREQVVGSAAKKVLVEKINTHSAA